MPRSRRKHRAHGALRIKNRRRHGAARHVVPRRGVEPRGRVARERGVRVSPASPASPAAAAALSGEAPRDAVPRRESPLRRAGRKARRRVASPAAAAAAAAAALLAASAATPTRLALFFTTTVPVPAVRPVTTVAAARQTVTSRRAVLAPPRRVAAPLDVSLLLALLLPALLALAVLRLLRAQQRARGRRAGRRLGRFLVRVLGVPQRGPGHGRRARHGRRRRVRAGLAPRGLARLGCRFARRGRLRGDIRVSDARGGILARLLLRLRLRLRLRLARVARAAEQGGPRLHGPRRRGLGGLVFRDDG